MLLLSGNKLSRVGLQSFQRRFQGWQTLASTRAYVLWDCEDEPKKERQSRSYYSTMSHHSKFVMRNWELPRHLYRQQQQQQQKQKQKQHHHQQQSRSYTPLIPVLVFGTIAAVGWTIHRKSKGKPVTPDEALAAQDAYRKQQERIQKQDEERARKTQQK